MLCILSAVLLWGTAARRLCRRDEDLRYVFGPCARNNTRAVFFYWEETCEGGDAVSPLWDLQCDVECPAGTFLGLDESLSQSKCQPCPRNTYSLSGIHRISGTRKDWLAEQHRFASYCWTASRQELNCSSWVPAQSGGYITPGDMSGTGWYQKDLVYYGYLTMPGKLLLKYTKVSSRLGGFSNCIFQVTVNTKSVLIDNNSQKEHYNEVTADVSPGPTDIIMSFRKYGNDYFSSVNISHFEVSGLSQAAHFCYPCVGGVSEPGSTTCSLCKENTYLAVNATDQLCENCPETHFSPVGSTGISSCVPRPTCTSSDFSFQLSPCIDGLRTVSYYWVEPLTCAPTVAVPLPQPATVTCESCDGGFYMKPVSESSREKECSPCSEGYSREDNSTIDECQKCPAGKFAPKVVSVTHWSPLAQKFELLSDPASCKQFPGWHASSGFFNASYLNSSALIPALSCDFTLQRTVSVTRLDASLQFLVSFNKSADSHSYFQFEVNGQLYADFHDSLADTYALVSISLEPGTNVLRWVHHQEDSSANDQCLIYSILIAGTEDGGARGCYECPTNHYSEEASSECKPCLAGFTHSKGHLGCEMCPKNTVSGPNGCIICPSNTEATSDHTHCVGLDLLKWEDNVFNVSQLTGRTTSNICASNLRIAPLCVDNFYGPIAGHNDSSFYISVLNAGNASKLPYFQGDPSVFAYAWGLFPNEIQSSAGECTPAAVLTNLGSEINEIQQTSAGFRVTYSKGRGCSRLPEERLGTEVDFICDKYEGEGWPLFVHRDQCRFKFEWRSRLACRKCDAGELVRVQGRCEEGERIIRVEEPEGCIFFENATSSLFVEDCIEGSDFLLSWPVLLGTGVLLLLALSTCILIRKLCNVQHMYMLLLQETDPRPDKDN